VVVRVNGDPRSRLEGLLRSGTFAVTAELGTVDSADLAEVRRVAEPLRGVVDAVNCTDNSAAHVHLSPVAAARAAMDVGLEPIVQFTCRDRNRLALQSDILGAAALGVRNVECMTGDDVSAGDHPEARATWDLDSLHLLRVARTMRDRGVFLSGRRLEGAPSFFLGAVENPFAPPQDFRPIRLGKKIEAGAEFFQLQIAFNPERLRKFMSRVVDLGFHERAFVLPSVCVPRSARALRYLRDEVPGIDVPADVLARLEGALPERQAEESIRMALETVAAIREMPGVAGIHLIAIKWEEAILQVAEEAGLLPRPELPALEAAER
jgi:5,10-methylenetetrahydrofolate reductase